MKRKFEKHKNTTVFLKSYLLSNNIWDVSNKQRNKKTIKYYITIEWLQVNL